MDKEQEQRILAQAIAKDDAKAISATSIGFSIAYIMDYGNGRQVTISGCLPLSATKEDFDGYLDKIRKATDRQQSFVILRDRQARLAATEKMVLALEHMIVEYEKEAEKQLKVMEDGPTKSHTMVKTQANNVREQVRNWKQNKSEELERQRSEVEICKVIIDGCKKEIGE